MDADRQLKEVFARSDVTDEKLKCVRFNAGCVNWFVEIGVAGCVRGGGATGVGVVTGVAVGGADGGVT